MAEEEYFGEWMKVIPTNEMRKALQTIYPINNYICPSYVDIFKAFIKCPYKDLRVIILGQDPYPQRGVATGIAFANSNNTPEDKISPSLKILKESLIGEEFPHNLSIFANDLEWLEEQGVLLLNAALTCKVNTPNSHSLIWRPFISKLIKNLCTYNTGLIFVLLGSQAQSFEADINSNQHIIKAYHPAYYYRNNIKMPSNIWQAVNNILIGINGYGIKFNGYENNNCK